MGMQNSRHKGRLTRISARRLVLLSGGIALALAGAAIIVLTIQWPFSRSAVEDRVLKDTGAAVAMGEFRTTYFPPGFFARAVELNSRKGGARILRIQQVRLRASYSGLIRKQIDEIDASGFHLTAGAGNSLGAGSGSGNSFGVSKLVAENGSVEIVSRKADHQPFRLEIYRIALTGIMGPQAKFQIAVASMRPPGEFRAEGAINRSKSKPLTTAGVSGQFRFTHADLGVFGGISGTLEASGAIAGSIGQLRWDGTALIPDFHLSGNAHRVRLESAYTVSLRTSDATADLDRVQVSFNQTTIQAQGRVFKNASDEGRTLQLAAQVNRGRIDDLLLLFSGAPRPGMTGSVQLKANVVLPPEPTKFLRRLRLNGDFEIRDAVFTNAVTQSSLNHLSESAGGEKKGEEQEDGRQIPGLIRGAVKDLNGLARLSGVQYSSPGVNANLGGAFNIINKALELQGMLATRGKLSDGTNGFKSLALHVARPFLPIHHDGKITTIPFTIRGTSSHPVLSVSLSRPHRSMHLAHR
jgi:hypothetical protein